jgi:peptidoglycan/LPS O-acetylase OafA/YrhL
MRHTEYMFVSVNAAAPISKAPAKGRDRYLDTLRAIAIFRVVFYHGFAFSWLPWIPAMGIMFALAGSLMVRSIDKSAKKAVTSRFRRLLPVVWAFGLIWIPLMIWHDGSPTGWTGEGDSPIPVYQLAFWILPIGDPPGSGWGEIAWGVLWYLKTYLWFVALSPVLLYAFRKKAWTPWLVFLLPFGLMMLADQGLIPSGGWFGSSEYDVLTYMGCWLIGFAHGTGLLKRIPLWLLVAIGATVAALGLLYMSGPGNAQAVDDGAQTWVIENSNFALSLYSFGIVFILMRFSSRMEWLKKHPIIDRIITIMNARAVTIYLWHNTALTLSMAAADRTGIEGWYFWFPLTWVLIFGFVLGFGWIEDFAARRKPELLPGKKKAPVAADAATPAQVPPVSPAPAGASSDLDSTVVNGWGGEQQQGYRGEPSFAFDGPDRRHQSGGYDQYRDNGYRDDRYQEPRGQYQPYQEDRRYEDRRDDRYAQPREREYREYGQHRDDRRPEDAPEESRGQRYPAQEYGRSQQYGNPAPQQRRPEGTTYGSAPRSYDGRSEPDEHSR